MVRFRQVPADVIAAAVVERKGVSLPEARTLAAYSEGGPGRAFRLADAPELREQRAALLDLAEKIARSPGIAAFRLAEELRNAAKPGKAKKGEDSDADAAEKTGRGDLARALDVLAAWHSDLLTVALRGPNAPLIHDDRRAAVAAASSRYRPEQLAENAESLAKFRRYLTRNANAQLATEALMLKLTPKAGNR
jgi:DNA polymerase-3 subunit delta'